ncbi:MAG: aldo/keto reductase [Spirochaetia bacterium]|nr:aldo/keto reductase [Spirochaetia bacterium]
MKIKKTIAGTQKLNNGVDIPYFGLGVWSAPKGADTENAVRWALEAGYRHIDTARAYNNEEDVGRAIRDSGIPRKEIFVTTKLARGEMGYDRTLRAFDESMDRLNLGFIDLYLIHWPTPESRKESWRALEKIAESGRARSIGVSNYTIPHLSELLKDSKVVPAVNQVELSPFLSQQKLRDFCAKHNILVEAYSPLTRGVKLCHPVVVEVAGKYKKTPGQILIRWCLEHDLVVFPKSIHQERIVENAGVFDFEIAAPDMAELDALNEDFRCNPDWNPEKEK